MSREHHHAFRLRQGVLEKLLGSCGVPAGKVKVWRQRWRQLSLQYVGGCVRIRGILWHSEFSEFPCSLLFYFAYIRWLWNVTRVVLAFFEILTFSFICSSFLFAFPMLNRILIRLLLLTSSSSLSRSDLRSLRDGHAASQCCRYICFTFRTYVCFLQGRALIVVASQVEKNASCGCPEKHLTWGPGKEVFLVLLVGLILPHQCLLKLKKVHNFGNSLRNATVDILAFLELLFAITFVTGDQSRSGRSGHMLQIFLRQSKCQLPEKSWCW